MNAKQRRFKAMADDVNVYLDNNSSIWSPIPAINSTKTEISDLLAEISQLEQEQDAAQTTLGSAIKQAKKATATKADIGSDALEAMATVNGNPQLASQADMSYSDYHRQPNNDFVTSVQNLIDLLTAHEMDLADYGFTNTQTTELQSSLDHFKELTTDSRQSRVESSQATQSLEEAIDRLRSALELLDMKMKIFKSSQPQFYTGYEAARVIVDV